MPRAKKGQQKVQNLKRRHGFAPLGVITLWCNVCISNMSSYSFFMNTSSLTMLRTDDNTGYMKGIQFFFGGGGRNWEWCRGQCTNITERNYNKRRVVELELYCTISAKTWSNLNFVFVTYFRQQQQQQQTFRWNEHFRSKSSLRASKHSYKMQQLNVQQFRGNTFPLINGQCTCV